MALIYATLIVKGRKTYGQVPAPLKDAVANILRELDCADLITGA